MRLTINEDTGELIGSTTNPTPRDGITVKRRDTPALDFLFARVFVGSLEVDAGAGASEFRFGGKLPGDFPGDYVVSNYDEGTDTFPHTKIILTDDDDNVTDVLYRLTPSFNTVALNEAFLVHPLTGTAANQTARFALSGLALDAVYYQTDTATYWQVIDVDQLANAAGWQLAEESESVELIAELQRTIDDGITSTITFTCTIENDVNRGNEGVPVDGTPAYPQPGDILLRADGAPVLFLAGLTGGGSTKLDGQTTAGVSVPRLFTVVIGDALSIYQLRAGTTAEASPGIIRPDDYNAGTNAKIFIQLS